MIIIMMIIMIIISKEGSLVNEKCVCTKVYLAETETKMIKKTRRAASTAVVAS